MTASGHIITAVIGAGILSLPYSLANLGELVRHPTTTAGHIEQHRVALLQRRHGHCPLCAACCSVKACCGWPWRHVLALSPHPPTPALHPCILAQLTRPPSLAALLGWVGGIAAMLAFAWVTLFTSQLLAEVHIVKGRRQRTYAEAVNTLLGRRGSVALAWLQYTNLILTALAYNMTAAMSLQ